MREIVVTSPTGPAALMFRYRIGDIGVWAEDGCTCGKPFPPIKQVTGPAYDHFIMRDGAHLHGGQFTRPVSAMPAICEFQVGQADPSRVRFRPAVEGKKPYDEPRQEDRLTKETLRVAGVECEMLREYPAEIAHNATGKHRFTISRVTHPHEP